MRPGVERQSGIGLGGQLGEAPRGVSLLEGALADVVAPPRRGLADADEGRRVARSEARPGGAVEPCIEGGCGVAAGRDELGRQELLEVWLVPHRPVAHERVAGMAAGVAPRQRGGEAAQVAEAGGQAVRAGTGVRPGGGAPDGDQDVHAPELRLPHEVVDVVEAVGGVERVGGTGRPDGSGARPVDDGAHEAGVRLPGRVEQRRAPGTPAEARVVLEADDEPGGRRHEAAGAAVPGHRHAEHGGGEGGAGQAESEQTGVAHAIHPGRGA